MQNKKAQKEERGIFFYKLRKKNVKSKLIIAKYVFVFTVKP